MSLGLLPPAGLTAEDIARFCEFFYRKTGISLDERRQSYAARRLADRMAASRSRSFREYFTTLRLQASGEELQAVINEMTVNETYFLREAYQFDALIRDMLPEIAARKRPGERIRIWCVPCSSGEEPYSVAIRILEDWPDADRYDIEIHGSDLDSAMLGRAKEGLYDARSLSRVSSRLREKYFHCAGEERWRICDELRGSIEFSRINIVDPVAMARMRGFDVIFCRNLLIYFDDLSRRLAAELMHEALTPGGFVCLGHSESMSRISSLFLPRKFDAALIYQKPRGEPGAAGAFP
jgi:chemotaxis protein methyltransferase CheR